MGATTDVIPTPIPPIIRTTIKKLNDELASAVTQNASSKFPKNCGGNIEPKAEITKHIAANIKAFFLPNLSVIVPATIHPKMVPNNADDTNQPSAAADRLKCCSRNVLQPDITAVS